MTDIQGTACVAVSGIFGALTVQGKPASEITKQRIVLVGAGSAGMGVAHFIRRSACACVLCTVLPCEAYSSTSNATPYVHAHQCTSSSMRIIITIPGMIRNGCSEEEAARNFWVLDQFGLVTEARGDVGELLSVFQRPTAEGPHEGEPLLTVVERVRSGSQHH